MDIVKALAYLIGQGVITIDNVATEYKADVAKELEGKNE